MGSCCSSNESVKKKKSNDIKCMENKAEMNRKIYDLLSINEVQILTIIYRDIASRCPQNGLDLQNFLLFFRKKGSWGKLLFQQFNHASIETNNVLPLQNFLLGIAKLYKSEEMNKANFLYNIFSQDTEGINFKQFVTMLYNYPKEDMKMILQDASFSSNSFKNSLIAIKPIEKKFSQSGSQETRGTIHGGGQSDLMIPETLDKSKSQQTVGCVKRLQENLIKNVGCSTHILLEFENQKYDVKTNSLHILVKKFAEKIFDQYQIEKKTGKYSSPDCRFKLEHLQHWLKNHPKLFSNYYDGFHSQIWSSNYDSKKQSASYLSQQIQMESDAKMIQKIVSGQKLAGIKVHLLLINSMLIIHEVNNKNNIINIIYLYGLKVTKIFDDKQGFGILIEHKDKIYPQKRFYFRNQILQLKWMEVLKYYKGVTVQQKYTLGNKIGAGTFANVFQCIENSSKIRFALKQIQMYKLTPQQKEAIAHQSAITSILDHPYLMKFHQSIQTKTHLYLITQFIEGINLFNYMQEKGFRLSQLQVAIIAKQIMFGLRYLHSLGIVHRDLKPQNIMVTNPRQFGNQQVSIVNPVKIKMIDFGFADYLKQLEKKPIQKLVAGSPNYIAPQVLQLKQISFKSDNFALGSIIYFMICGTLPFNGENIHQVLKKNKSCNYKMEGARWNNVSQQAKNLIKMLLQKDPHDRISLKDAICHVWFNQNIEKHKSKLEISEAKDIFI